MISVAEARDAAERAFLTQCPGPSDTGRASLVDLRHSLLRLINEPQITDVAWNDVADLVLTVLAVDDDESVELALNAAKKRALDESELNVWVSNLEGLRSIRQGHFQQARVVLQHALVDAGLNELAITPTLQYNLAVVEHILGNYDKAERLLATVDLSRGGALAEQVGQLKSAITNRLNFIGYYLPSSTLIGGGENNEIQRVLATAQMAYGAFKSAISRGLIDRAAEASEVIAITSQRLCGTIGSAHPLALGILATHAVVEFELALAGDSLPSLNACIDRLEFVSGQTRRALGALHPRTLVVESNTVIAKLEFARRMQDRDKFRAELETLRQLSDRIARVLGGRHPKAISVLSSLATAEASIARADRAPEEIQLAIGRLEQASAGLSAAYGSGHPAVALIERELRACRQFNSGSGDGILGGVGLLVRAPASDWDGWNERYISVDAAERAVELNKPEDPEESATEEQGQGISSIYLDGIQDLTGLSGRDIAGKPFVCRVLQVEKGTAIAKVTSYSSTLPPRRSALLRSRLARRHLARLAALHEELDLLPTSLAHLAGSYEHLAGLREHLAGLYEEPAGLQDLLSRYEEWLARQHEDVLHYWLDATRSGILRAPAEEPLIHDENSATGATQMPASSDLEPKARGAAALQGSFSGGNARETPTTGTFQKQGDEELISVPLRERTPWGAVVNHVVQVGETVPVARLLNGMVSIYFAKRRRELDSLDTGADGVACQPQSVSESGVTVLVGDTGINATISIDSLSDGFPAGFDAASERSFRAKVVSVDRHALTVSLSRTEWLRKLIDNFAEPLTIDRALVSPLLTLRQAADLVQLPYDEVLASVASGEYLYLGSFPELEIPAAFFSGNAYDANLKVVVGALRAGDAGMSLNDAVTWLFRRNHKLDGRTPMELIRDGSIGAVLAAMSL